MAESDFYGQLKWAVSCRQQRLTHPVCTLQSALLSLTPEAPGGGLGGNHHDQHQGPTRTSPCTTQKPDSVATFVVAARPRAFYARVCLLASHSCHRACHAVRRTRTGPARPEFPVATATGAAHRYRAGASAGKIAHRNQGRQGTRTRTPRSCGASRKQETDTPRAAGASGGARTHTGSNSAPPHTRPAKTECRGATGAKS